MPRPIYVLYALKLVISPRTRFRVCTWMLKQVQHDDARVSTIQHLRHAVFEMKHVRRSHLHEC